MDRPKSFLLRNLLFGLIYLGICACRSRDYNVNKSSQKSVTLTEAKEESSASDFRNIFYTYMKQAQYPDERIQQQIFAVPPELLVEGAYSSTGTDALSSLRERFAKSRPSDFYQLGLRTPFQNVANPEAVFARTGPVTIVLIPGIFGEFIENRPFEEVLGSGSFSVRFQPLLKSRTTSVYSLEKMDKIMVPLSDAVSVGSIDNSTGQPLVNLILLRPGFASLETLGTFESNTETYLQRLAEVFSVIPQEVTKNLYLMGYSRGTGVALNLLTTAARNSQVHHWVNRVRGFVGLAGVWWGTELADDALDESEKSSMSKAIGTLNWLSNELKTTDEVGGLSGLLNGTTVVAHNTAKWMQAAAEFALLMKRQQSEAPAGAIIEAKFLKADQLDLMATGNLLWRVALQTFNLSNPAGDYNNNVRKFKKFISEAVAGLKTLTIKSNTQWWRQNTLPERIKMFSVTASMPDGPVGETPSPMLSFEPYGPRTADFVNSLRGSFFSLAALSKNQLNDSQVTIYGSRYWPGLNRFLNPSQVPLKHYFLGTLGTHHWGLAFPIGFKMANSDVNHFPRAVLLKSIGTYLALSQE